MIKKKKLPKDANQRAKAIVDLATGQNESTEYTSDGKNAAAVALGKIGGEKGLSFDNVANTFPKPDTDSAKTWLPIFRQFITDIGKL